jgi:hypothetical protein
MPDATEIWGKIIIGGLPYAIEWPKYVNFLMDPNFNAHTPRCVNSPECSQLSDGIHPYASKIAGNDDKTGMAGAARVQRFRPRFRIRKELQKFQETPEGFRPVGADLSVAQAAISQFVLHHDGCLDARMCFNVLHNERGLSCHYILDNDGTFYQTLDLLAAGFHAQFLNDISIGIEMCNRGDARKEPEYYKRKNMPRDVVNCTINGCKFVAFDFTPEQKAAMTALGRALSKHLPGIRLDYPKDPLGKAYWNTMPDGGRSWSGYIGHYHSINQKWDPGPFDFEAFIRSLRGGQFFPLALPGTSPEIPEEKEKREASADAFYQNNEREYTLEGGDTGKPAGGFYPIGPFDQYRLWHGGIHLHAALGSPVSAVAAGKIVAARSAEIAEGIGSTSFVLVKHEFTELGLEFYTLYFHLQLADAEGDAPKWMSSDGWGEHEPGTVVVLEPPEPVQGGDVLGYVGPAGPDDEPQIHFEVFATPSGHKALSALDARSEEPYWQPLVDGSTDGRFCNQKAILDLYRGGKKGDAPPSGQDILAVYRNPDEAAKTRRIPTYHVSEWAEKPDWLTELSAAVENKKMKKAELEQLVNQQIKPTLWMTEEVLKKLGLPDTAVLVNYHPIAYLNFLQAQLGGSTSAAVTKASDADMNTVISAEALKMTDDGDARGDEFMQDEADAEAKVEKQPTLEQIIDGYGD